MPLKIVFIYLLMYLEINITVVFLLVTVNNIVSGCISRRVLPHKVAQTNLELPAFTCIFVLKSAQFSYRISVKIYICYVLVNTMEPLRIKVPFHTVNRWIILWNFHYNTHEYLHHFLHLHSVIKIHHCLLCTCTYIARWWIKARITVFQQFKPHIHWLVSWSSVLHNVSCGMDCN